MSIHVSMSRLTKRGQHDVAAVNVSWRDVTLVAAYALLSRAFNLNALQPVGFLPLFDSSPEIILRTTPPATLRWDTLHFLGIAKDGYQYEQQAAFQPGWPACMRLGGLVLQWVLGSRLAPTDEKAMVYAGTILAVLSYAAAAVMLFRLSCLVRSRAFAWITVLLYLLSPTPAVLSSAMTEPAFACLTLSGFYLAAKGHHAAAVIPLALSSSVRSTGIFSAAVLGWMILFDARPASRFVVISRCVKAGMLGLLVTAPFIAFQIYAYLSFCSSSELARQWCQSRIPLVYSFVQAEYWNVGFLQYWTFEQVPNLIIALPVLIPSTTGSVAFLTRLYRSPKVEPLSSSERILLPIHLHHIGMTALLVFSSHTQIALRLVSSDPVLWWNVADMSFDWSGSVGSGRMTRAGKWWAWWSVLWGAASLVLWAGFYPPA